jgi:hypothetical protein
VAALIQRSAHDTLALHCAAAGGLPYRANAVQSVGIIQRHPVSTSSCIALSSPHFYTFEASAAAHALWWWGCWSGLSAVLFECEAHVFRHSLVIGYSSE